MSRCAILPFPGDPFLLHYWLSFYGSTHPESPRWGNYIDTLYIYFNSPIEEAAVKNIEALCNYLYIGIHLIYNNQQIEHGEAINRTLDVVKEDYIMLIEDDGFIFKPEIVDVAFKMIETGGMQIVGSKRGSCHMEILSAAQKKWGLNYEGYGDQGPNFWPCFFFCRKDLLLKTDRQFGARAWKQGEIVLPLEHEVLAPQIHSDTFVNTSLQLRAIVPENQIAYFPQYHGNTDDYPDYLAKTNLCDGKAPWTHAGSLSSGVGGILTDDQGRALARRKIDPPKGSDRLPNYCNTEQERLEWERRVMWWERFWRFAAWNENIAEFYDLYKKAIDRIVKQYGLDEKRIEQRLNIYRELGL